MWPGWFAKLQWACDRLNTGRWWRMEEQSPLEEEEVQDTTCAPTLQFRTQIANSRSIHCMRSGVSTARWSMYVDVSSVSLLYACIIYILCVECSIINTALLQFYLLDNVRAQWRCSSGMDEAKGRAVVLHHSCSYRRCAYCGKEFLLINIFPLLVH